MYRVRKRNTKGYGMSVQIQNKNILEVPKLNFDNLFIKDNWKYLGLHKYNTKQKILNLSIIK